MNNNIKLSEAIEITIGIVIGLIIGAFLLRLLRTDKKMKSNYDERQKLIRGKGYKMAFCTLVVYEFILMIGHTYTDNLFMDYFTERILGIFLAIGVHGCYCIMHDGYFALNDKNRGTIVSIIVIGMINIFLGVDSVISGVAVDDGRLTYRSINLICGAMLLAIGITLLVKFRKDRENEESLDDGKDE